MTQTNKALLVFQVLLAVVIVAASLIIMTSSLKEVRVIRAQFRGNLTYYAAQVDYELLQIVDHINRYVQDDPSVTPETLIMRLDIAWSRLSHNTSNLRGDLYLALPGASAFAEEALETLNAIEPELVALKRDDDARAIAITSELRRLVTQSHAVAMQAIAYDAENDAIHLDGMTARNRSVMYLILAFLGLAAFSLYQSWREVRTSFRQSAHLERRVEARTSELKTSNRKLRAEIDERGRAQERFRSLVDHATDAILILDAQKGTFVEANPRAEALYGLPREALLAGCSPIDLSPEFQPDGQRSDVAAVAYVKRALDGEVPIFEWMHRNIEGVDVPCQISLVRFPDTKRDLVRGSIIDLTEMKNAEASNANLERQLVQAQKLEAVGQMTGGVAHDFNNLLSVILGNMELLEDLTEDRDKLELIDAAKQASLRGAALTRSMLNFARRADLNPQEISLGELVGGMELWMSRTIPVTINVETSFSPDLWSVTADVSGAESALLNLVINARDAMPYGGCMTIETENVLVDKASDEFSKTDLKPGRYVMLAVRDTGEGIPADVMPRIFEPFFSTKGLSTNSGLGLSMVHGFMTQSCGDVIIDSEPGVGTTVKLFFPAHDKGQGTTALEEDDQSTTRVPKARILVAEDQEDVLNIIARSLEAQGHHVTTTKSGDEAASRFDELGPFDLLITDIVMPGDMQGPALARHLRSFDQNLPVIFLSGYTNEAILNGNGLRKEDLHLMKPVAREKLIAAVNEALTTKRSHASPHES
ncbi:MAG: response regulator [Marinovum sp.]|nr:response regulator [Marinovum sp.]